MSDAQTIERPDTGTDVAIIGGTVTALTVFATEGGVDAILERITAQARAVETDISTPTGRKAVASLAYKIARSKTALDAMGKDLGEQNYRAWKAITSERARIETALDALGAEIRKPLTDWENAEKARIAAHEAALAALCETPGFYAAPNSAEELGRRLAYLKRYPALNWQEFAKRAEDTLAAEIAMTRVALAAAEKREAAAAEAKRLAREEAEAAAARELERQRQREVLAAENARREAEERARVAAEAAEQKARDDAAALAARVAERARIDAEHLAAVERQKQEASDRADKAEADRLAATAKALADLARAAEEAEAKRKADVGQAAAAERKRIADEQAAQAAEATRREANMKHRARINNEALADVMLIINATDLSIRPECIAEEAGRAVVTAIARGEVRHTRIQY